MTSVNEKTFADPMTAYEDGLSVPGETRCSAAPAAKGADSAPAAGGQVDTFETLQADPRRAELERINEQRRQLRPELDKKREEALRAVPKMVPVLGSVADVAFGVYDAARAMNGAQADNATKAGADGIKAAGELVAFKAAVEVGSESAKFVSGAAMFKNAYTVYSAMREYGKVVNKDEELKRKAEDIEMQLDPSKKFELVEIGGKKFYRQNGRLVPDEKPAPATQAQRELCERLAKGK